MKIMQLTTYPIVNPLHGGQIRVAQIRKKLEQLNHVVKTISISEPQHAQYHPEDDLIVDYASIIKPESMPFCTDLLTAKQCTTNKIIYRFLANHLSKFNPTTILLEQPWLWPAVKKAMQEIPSLSNLKIIYSSHNVESKTKESILNTCHLSADKIQIVVNDIQYLEQDLLKVAHGLICVTREDANHFQKFFKGKTIICANGVSLRKPCPTANHHLRQKTAGRPYAFFTGSSYRPNALGFWQMMGPSLAQFPPETMILVAGGVGSVLDSHAPKEALLYMNVNNRVIKKLGYVDEDMLAAMIDNASVIILPIVNGGGSNLKTAEAIAAAKPVVATTIACRGFDFVKDLSHFYICDHAKDFPTQVVSLLLNKKQLTISDNEYALRQKVYWDSTLANIEDICR